LCYLGGVGGGKRWKNRNLSNKDAAGKRGGDAGRGCVCVPIRVEIEERGKEERREKRERERERGPADRSHSTRYPSTRSRTPQSSRTAFRAKCQEAASHYASIYTHTRAQNKIERTIRSIDRWIKL
jgi:hypothetical protein